MKTKIIFLALIMSAMLAAQYSLAQEAAEQASEVVSTETKIFDAQKCSQDSDCSAATSCLACNECFSTMPVKPGDIDCAAYCMPDATVRCKCINGQCAKETINPKDKAALCSEKVVFKGPCRKACKGFQFNQATGKCEEISGSCCSQYSPFKTIKECQKRCEKRK